MIAPDVVAKLRRYTRSRRGRLFRDFIDPLPRPLRVIDLGGTVRFWEAWGVTPEDRLHITLINSHETDTTQRGYVNRHPFITDRVADALALTDADFGDFDLVFSNSFIEHLSCWGEQAAIAAKVTRSGLPYFVQTPNKHAPVDPHFPSPLVPFFALYPKRLQARLLTLGSLGGGCRHPSVEHALARLRHYNLLGRKEMRALFPDGELAVERPFGVPMSIIAHRRPGGAGISPPAAR